MRINITGGSQRQKNVINEMMPWVGKKLLSKRIYRDVEIDVEIKNLSKEDFRACTLTHEDYPLTTSPRKFQQEYSNKRLIRDLREDIVHEMVHINQYATGKLYDYERTDRVRWKGKIYPYSMESTTQYRSLPYEVEAQEQEKKLVREFKQRGKK